MRAAIFFTYICFLLVKVYGTYTDTHHHSSSYAPFQHIEQTQLSKSVDAIQDYALVEDNGLNKEDEYFIGEEVEDDDVNNIFSKKNRLLSRCNLSLFNPFVLTNLHNHYKVPQPFGSLLSDKHITLRVLRI